MRLAIHPGALGDVLLAIPALRALRAAAGGDELVFAAQPRIAALLVDLGIADQGLDVESLGLGGLFVDDGPPPADVLGGAARVVCWFGAGDPAFVERLRRVARDAAVASPAGQGDAPVWRHLLETVGGGAGGRELPVDGWERPVDVPERLAAEGAGALGDAGWDGSTPLVVAHPGAGGGAKRWAPQGFACVLDALADRRRCAVVLHEGPADADAVAAVRLRLRAPALLLREPPLGVLAGALRHATAFLGNDSGVTHLAVALGVPALALFTASHRRWAPWSVSATIHVVALPGPDAGDVEAVTRELLARLR